MAGDTAYNITGITMTAQSHFGTRANYLKLTINQMRTLTDPDLPSEGYINLVTELSQQVALHNTTIVLDCLDLAKVYLVGGLPNLLRKLTTDVTNGKVPFLYVNHDSSDPKHSFDYVALSTLRLTMHLMGMPFAFTLHDPDTLEITASILDTGVMASSHQSVILQVYEKFKIGQEFTTADLIEYLPVPEGKTLSTHSSSLGNALKTICTKYPNLLCFDSRMVRNDDPKKRNQNMFFYRIPNQTGFENSSATPHDMAEVV